jgi:hypothetical protein
VSAASSVARGERLARALGFLLLGFAVIGLAYGLVREIRDGSRAAATAPVPATALGTASARATTVYYFHAHTRCDTCLAIERQTSELIAREFAKETADGSLVFSIIDFDEPEHRHFRERFILSFGAVVVAEPNDGAWEVLNDVWTLVDGDRAAFDAYVQERVRTHLRAGASPAP